jgi:hypothetical protein
MIDIMIFRDSNKIELKNDCNMLIVSYFLSNIKSFLLVFLWEKVENFNMF